MEKDLDSELKKFCEVISELPAKTVRAWRMDGCPDMREHVGLVSQLHCCDYLRIDQKEVILIEATDLAATIEYIKSKRDISIKEISRNLGKEIRLKFYGAMLVLCRLGLCEEQPVLYILYTNEVEKPGAAKALRNKAVEFHELKKHLTEWLKSSLGKMISRAGVMGPKKLQGIL